MRPENHFHYQLDRSNLTRINHHEWILRYHKMNDWCHNNCKNTWFADDTSFWFSDEKDYNLFLLRWA